MHIRRADLIKFDRQFPVYIFSPQHKGQQSTHLICLRSMDRTTLFVIVLSTSVVPSVEQFVPIVRSQEGCIGPATKSTSTSTPSSANYL